MHGPALVVDKPSKQQIEVLYIKSGRTAIKHYSHAVQFFRPICSDAEELMEYSSAPRLYQTYEGRRVSPEEREKLINELEKGLPGGKYLSPMDDLEEIDTLLEDKFNLTDYPWDYDEEITKKRRELFESNTVEGETMRQSVEDLVEEEEVPEEIDKKEEEEEQEKEVSFKDLEPRRSKRLKKQHEKLKFVNMSKTNEKIVDRLTYQLMIAKRNADRFQLFQKNVCLTDPTRKEKSLRRVRFKI